MPSSTDAPWCTMTSTHASKQHLTSLLPALSALFFPPACRPDRFVAGHVIKGRNEPCAIGGVAWVVAKVLSTVQGAEKDTTFEKVCEAAWKNTVEVFGLEDDMVELTVPVEPEPPKPQFDIKAEEWPAL